MKKEDFSEAKRIEKEIDQIKYELSIWETCITKKRDLACDNHGGGYKNLYQKGSDRWESSMSNEVFLNFRKSVINELKIKIIDFESKFSKIGCRETNGS